MTLTVATCQFPVSADPRRNGAHIRAFVAEAAAQGAEIVHFGECALSGYCRANFPSWDGYDWTDLRREMRQVMDTCRRHGVWGVIGGSHRLTGGNHPHNSVYVVTPEGRIADRYDKRRCSVGDLTCHTPGDHPVIFDVKGIRCGILICMEEKFPDLWQEYSDAGVTLVFHSTSGSLTARADTDWTAMARILAQANAQQHQLFISQASWCPSFQEFPSLWVERGGHAVHHCTRHVPGLMLNRIPDDAGADAYSRMVRQFRAGARSGALYTDHYRDDPRSRDRTAI
ncbi:carbon-nitrogen family hydrolase (plasmid) [Azospirillum sp. B510]|uniref:carbon-nitrogen hydrolase family protein n=1 Tax=Azospirillum sp. (strain B510) TaxID=137722 RepID=UPI0001C4CAB2|nr:carbon-nitrogen hydrolase family protein [Azospirillum sp. B510]BAI75297.1 carbon-nitrogen family hydrolase [Azospirillum sp. B510]